LWTEKPFDEYLFGLEDIDWARYVTGRGYLVHYEPSAAIYHIHRETWQQVFNRYRREAIAAARIGTPHPPQSKTEVSWLLKRIAGDLVASFPSYGLSRVVEIFHFRLNQWQGTRQGWFRDKYLDLERGKSALFYGEANEAVVIESSGNAKLKKLPLSELLPGDVLVHVAYVGICKTDLEVCEGTLGYYKDGIAHYPIVPGHEYSGKIVKIGASPKLRERFKTGDSVVGECIISRGEKGERKEVGVVNHNGAYSSLVVVPGDLVHIVPSGMDLSVAALAEPLAVVLRALRRAKTRITPNSSVAVIGAGTIGHFCAQVLCLDGHSVDVFDKNEEKLSYVASIVSDTHVEIENLQKYDVIVEATGSEDALKSVLKQSGLNSTVVLLGFPYGESDYNFEDLVGKEKVFIGSVGAESEDFEEALRILPKLDTKQLVGHVYPLREFERGWSDLRAGRYLKILLKP
jgi:2-desacetyl-2-hydroxyethyl bacteriochlorophyllide A dehydrogenase